jgi:hypothetical protein
MATGFRTSFPFLPEQTTTPQLHLMMMHPTIPSLYFIGLFQPLACIWRLAHYQSRIAALQLSGRLSRPPDIHEVADHVDRSPRHAIEVDYHTFRGELLNELRRDPPSAL